jgi:hypothetical protein
MAATVNIAVLLLSILCFGDYVRIVAPRFTETNLIIKTQTLVPIKWLPNLFRFGKCITDIK